MGDSIQHSPPTNPRDAGLAALILWIIVFAGFMVALIALESGGQHLTTAHEAAPPAMWAGPA
jgi:hypothetical protein